MKLYIENKEYDWMDSYVILDADGNTKFSVKSILMAQVGHEHIISDDREWEIGRVKERLSTMRPVYEIIQGGRVIGKVKTDRSFFKKEFMYLVTFQDWKVEGDLLQCAYSASSNGRQILTYGKEEKNGTEYLVIDIAKDLPPDTELKALMLTCGIHLMRTSNLPG